MWRLIALALLLLPAAASAHEVGGQGSDAAEIFSVSVSLLAYCAVYLRGYLRLRGAARPGAVGPLQLASFLASVFVLGLALLPPLSRAGEDLFSFHMAQHLLLMLAAAPLIVACRPIYVSLWALPRDGRRAVARWFRGSALALITALVQSPLFVWIAFTGVFVFWHLPGPYAFALSHAWGHALEHLTFVASACAFWSVVIEPSGRRRLDYGAAILYVATAAVLSSMPGALMVLTTRPLYAVHAAGAARWGISLIEDQQLAGLIMWIPAGFAYMAAIVVLFVLWLQAAERRARLRGSAFLRNGVLFLLIAPLLTGCDDRGSSMLASLGLIHPKSDIGDADAGARAISTYGCGSCHEIPGIAGARGLVGPPLTRMGRRVYIAGVLRNTPENMIAWLRDPQQIVPGNAMPNVGLSDEQARNVAAYLESLR